MKKPSLLSVALFLTAVCRPTTEVDAKPVAKVTIKGNGKALGITPLVVPVKAGLAPGNYMLGSGLGFASVFKEGDTTYLATVIDKLPAEGELTASLQAISQPDDMGIKVTPGKEETKVTINGKPFTSYLAHSGPRPYFFPVIGPTGKPMTRAYPMQNIDGEKQDHPHHRSFWFTHGNVNGIDFWSESKGHGTIVETSFKSVSTASYGAIITTNDWLGPDGNLVLKDERTVRFFFDERLKGKVLGRQHDVADPGAERIIDFDITLKATNAAVTFGDTKEGMFGVRVATSMDVLSKKGGMITTSDGLTDDKAWGKPAAWVDYTGPVDNETVGVAILNHPSSFRHPTTWHVRTYGLFAANPFGWHDFKMDKKGDHTVLAGDSIHFGYRVILHKGDTASAGLPAQYEAYAHPPTVEVKVE